MNQSKHTPTLVYSDCEDSGFSEDFCSMIDSLLCANENLEEGMTYYIGEKREWKPSDFAYRGIEESVIEGLSDQAWQEADEWAEDFATNVSDEAKAELRDAIKAWSDKHLRCDFFTVEKVRKAELTADEAIEFDPSRATGAEAGE